MKKPLGFVVLLALVLFGTTAAFGFNCPSCQTKGPGGVCIISEQQKDLNKQHLASILRFLKSLKEKAGEQAGKSPRLNNEGGL